MNTTLDTLHSLAAHGSFAGVNWIWSCTPWKMNFVSPSPASATTPLVRYRCSLRSFIKPCMNLLNSCELSGVEQVRPTDPTPERSCFFSLVFFPGSLLFATAAAATSACPCTSALLVSPNSLAVTTGAAAAPPWPCSCGFCVPSASHPSMVQAPSGGACPCPCPCDCCVPSSFTSGSGSSSYSSSAPAMRSSEKALRLRILFRSTRELRVSICSAKELMELTVVLRVLNLNALSLERMAGALDEYEDEPLPEVKE